MTERKPYLVRLDPELLDQLRRWAADELRSLNGQIEYLLRRAVEDSGRARKQGKAGKPGEGPA